MRPLAYFSAISISRAVAQAKSPSTRSRPPSGSRRCPSNPAEMDIEIEDRHPFGAVRGLRVANRDRRIVEEAKSHRRGGSGMMAGRTHRDEGILGAAAHDLIDRRHNATHAMRDCREALHAHG